MIKATHPIYKKILNNLIILTIITAIYLSAVLIQHQRYQKNTFNCIDMTQEAKTFWETLGFKTKPMCGRGLNNGTSHMWLKIQITPTLWLHWESCHLRFMNPWDHYENIHQMYWW